MGSDTDNCLDDFFLLGKTVYLFFVAYQQTIMNMGKTLKYYTF